MMGIRFVVLCVPSETQVMHSEIYPAPQMRLERIAQELGFFLIDPLSDFQQRAKSGQVDYHTLNKHFNVQGHEFVADLLMEALEERQIIPPHCEG